LAFKGYLTLEAALAKRRYVVNLNAEERTRLEDMIRKGKSPARRQLKARILLQSDSSERGAKWSDAEISSALATYPAMCVRVRRQWHTGGLDAVLIRKPRATPPTPRIFDGAQEAKLIALACSPPPEGRAGWTLRLLESRVVELNIVDRASDNTIGRVLKKMRSSRISSSNGSLPRGRTALS
jgi:Homeodomain-like domain